MNKSEQTNELSAAMAKAQAEMKIAEKNGLNPHFKNHFSTIADIWKASVPALSKNGLSVVQSTEATDDGRCFLVTLLLHTSGQWISGRYPIISMKQDPQSLKSAITYAKRATWDAMVGLASEEDDDDGNAASESEQKRAAPASKSPNPQQGSGDPKGISDAQIKRLYAICKAKGWTESQLKSYMQHAMGFDSTRMLDRKQYDDLCHTIETKNFTEVMRSKQPQDDGPPPMDYDEEIPF